MKSSARRRGQNGTREILCKGENREMGLGIIRMVNNKGTGLEQASARGKIKEQDSGNPLQRETMKQRGKGNPLKGKKNKGQGQEKFSARDKM